MDGADKVLRAITRERQRAQGEIGDVMIETMVNKICFEDERRAYWPRMLTKARKRTLL